MKFRFLISLLFLGASFTSASFTSAAEVDPLEEISMASPELIVLLDDQVRSTCNELINLRQKRGHECNDEYVAQLLDPALHELDYETVLLAMHACIATENNARTPQEQTLRTKIQLMYDQLLDEYDQLVAQTSTRRIKCKHFCTVTTRDLVVNNNACITKLFIKDALTVNNLTGAIIANNGRISTGEIPADAIPDGSITNAKLADNAVTSDKIAPATITPDETAFNPVVAADTNGEAKPLYVYRGLVQGDGTISSGTGFSVNRAGAGPYTYTITLNATAYTSATSYSAFFQADEAVTFVASSGTEFDMVSTNSIPFSFFTIGA